MGRQVMGLFALWAVACSHAPEVRFVDQIDEGTAVLVRDDGRAEAVDAAKLPAGAREGDVLVDGRVDEDEKLRRLLRIKKLERALQAKDDGADFSLEDRR